jgi:hypothetical protein
LSYPEQEFLLAKVGFVSMPDMNASAAPPEATEPIRYFVATGLLDPETLEDIQIDFPEIKAPGIFPMSDLNYGPAFRNLIEDIRNTELEDIMSQRFELDLVNKPLMITTRGRCQGKDGRVHTDTESKLVTALFYLDDVCDSGGGRLQFPRGPDHANELMV